MATCLKRTALIGTLSALALVHAPCSASDDPQTFQQQEKRRTQSGFESISRVGHYEVFYERPFQKTPNLSTSARWYYERYDSPTDTWQTQEFTGWAQYVEVLEQGPIGFSFQVHEVLPFPNDATNSYGQLTWSAASYDVVGS